MSDELATWILLSSGNRRRMLYVDGRTGEIHRVFEEEDEVWRRLDIAELLGELMLDPERDRLVLVASPEELDELDCSFEEEVRELVSLKVDRDLSRIADPLVVHVVHELMFDRMSKQTVPVACAPPKRQDPVSIHSMFG